MDVDWESRYRSGDTPWEKGAPHPALADYLAEHKLTGDVLVPGCGLGHDVRAISGPQSRVIGIDIAPSAIQAASGFPVVAAESYQLEDLFDLPVDFRTAFDWVVEHTCFCAIEPSRRGDYARAVAAALKPGGMLLAIFYLDPGQEEGPPFGVGVDELEQLFGGLFEVEESRAPHRTYPGREGRELLRLLKRR